MYPKPLVRYSVEVVLVVLGGLACVAGLPPQNLTLPMGWEDACTLASPLKTTDDRFYSFSWPQNIVRVSCVLSEQHFLEWEDFRSWSNGSAITTVALEITCPVHGAGTIRLPWPMKALNLIYLTVDNCGLTDYYGEYFDVHLLGLPDTLQVLELIDCVIYFGFHDVRRIVTNIDSVSPEAHCGHLTLEKYVARNLSYELDLKAKKIDISKISTLLLTNSSGFYSASQIIPTVCHYEYLQYMDESSSQFLGRKHFFLQQFKSIFPEMQFYNLSNMNLMTVPYEIQHWRFKFPKLEYLDLSRNNIASFSFVDYDPTSTSPGEIDLRFNNFSEIPESLIKNLKSLPSAFVNLRNNPIKCECHKNSYLFEYLQREDSFSWNRSEKYEYIRTLPCSSPEKLSGVPFNAISRETIFCKEATPVALIVTLTLLAMFVLLVILLVIFIRYLKSRQSKSSVVIFAHVSPEEEIRAKKERMETI